MRIKTETILVGISVVLGFAATLLFITTGQFKSPITDGLLTLLFGTGILFFTQRTEEETIMKGGLTIFSITAVFSVLYVVTRFDLGQLALSAVFAFFTIMFLLSAYLYTRERKILTERRSTVITVIILLLFLSVLVVDVTAADPRAEIALDDNVTAMENEYQTNIGELQITNPSILPQEFDDYPDHTTCLTGVNLEGENPSSIPDTVAYTDKPGTIFNEASANVSVRYPLEGSGTVSIVETDQCPESTAEPTIHFLS